MRRLVALLPILMAGCSLGRLESTPCTATAECKGAFGWDAVCGVEGYCEPLSLPERCSVEPADLFEKAETTYADAMVIGHLWQNSSFATEGRSVRLAISQAGESGGLGGRPLALVSCNNEAMPGVDDLDAEAANLEMARFLVEQVEVPAIVGPTTSGEAEAAFTVASPAGTVLISPSATSPALTALDGLSCSDADPGMLWRTAPPDSLQGRVIADYLAGEIDFTGDDPALERVAVVYEEGSYGEGLLGVFDQEFDGDVTLHPFDSASDQAPVRLGEIAADVGDEDRQAVVLIASTQEQIVAFLQAASVLPEYESMIIMLTDGAYYADIFNAAGEASELFPNIRGTRPTIDYESSAFRTYSAAHSATYSEDPGLSAYTAHSWDAAWLALYGAAWAQAREGAVTGLGISRGLRNVSRGDPIEIKRTSWSTVQATFEAGRPVDVSGASGSLDYDETTCETTAPIEIWTVISIEGSWGFGAEGIIEP